MHAIVLYDGVCALCNRLVRFILKRDRKDSFRFAALQSGFARDILQRHGLNPDALDTVYVVLNHGVPDERVLERNDAVAAVLNELGAGWRMFGKLMETFPAGLARWCYNLIARRRYRIFGKHESCPLPDAAIRHKFLDLGDKNANRDP